jgi:hypothetical protein
MLGKDDRQYLENLVQGNECKGQKNMAATARNYLCRSFKASTVAERKFDYFQRIKKEQEAVFLIKTFPRSRRVLSPVA